MSEYSRVAIYLQDKHSIPESIEFAKYAEKKKFEAVWQAESRLARVATIPIAAMAAVTKHIKLGTGVVNNLTRNVALMAATFSTLDQMAKNRFICGLGAWWEPLATKVGTPRKKPLKLMREYTTVMKKLLNMETVTFQGEFVQVDGIRLDIVHGDPDKPRKVPIYIGATGMKMMELTGELCARKLADGVVLNYMVSPDYNHTALKHLKIGAKKGGGSLEDIDRPQLIVCSMDHDREKALDEARELLTQYMGQQPHLMKASKMPQDILDKIHEELTWPATKEEIRKAMRHIPDEIVQKITASGKPNECVEQVQKWIESGCTSPVLYQLSDDVKLMIDAFSPDKK
ncbi:MAG: LLM class flavin-dependent oxidoreductase [Candidatus Hodarchaeales archaeon]